MSAWFAQYQSTNSINKIPLISRAAAAAAKSLQLCPTLWNPMDCSLPGSSVHRIFQARILEWIAIHFSRRSSPRRNWTWVSCTIGRFFTIWVSRMMLLFVSHSLLPQSQTIILTTILWKFSWSVGFMFSCHSSLKTLTPYCINVYRF